jgi:hypothetical protein
MVRDSQRLLATILASAIGTGIASADCICQCVNGSVEAICNSSIDVTPVCGPAVCPIVSPSVNPVESPQVPPVGTTWCHNQQVWNPNTGRYEWERLCE